MNLELKKFLLSDLSNIKGVGNILSAKFSNLLGNPSVLNFLLHTPSYIIKREAKENIKDFEKGEIATINLFIKEHNIKRIYKKKIPSKIICKDSFNNTVIIQFFSPYYIDYWLKKLPLNTNRTVSGRLDISKKGEYIISHPDFVEESCQNIPKLQTIYSSTEGISQKHFINIRNLIFEKLDNLLISETYEIKDFFQSIKNLHFPIYEDSCLFSSKDVEKLAYFELLADQTAIFLSRKNRQYNKKPQRLKKYDFLSKFLNLLPFKLTNAQNRVIDEIFKDLDKDVSMMRLLQGDVGSGKTIIAFLSAIYVCEKGAQVAFMAPTDTLALQHFEKIKEFTEKLGIVSDILTGRDKGKTRKEKLISIRSGRTKIIIGTHALFSEDVLYKDLALVIIDEQHRFGVNQRDALRLKGNHPDLLAMSATPIPRTLSMTMYGDMDISILDEKPAGRIPIITTKLPDTKISSLINRIQLKINSGEKVFWICPLIEESENFDLINVELRFKILNKIIKNSALIHGKMDKTERDKIMNDFANKNINLLVATTVIEVGIDIKEATIIVIENSERFGLATLHQLRGRVGRNNKQSYCVLLYKDGIPFDSIKRLNVMCETDDGFKLAEQDLIMRGTGELLGTKQSGWKKYYFADYRYHHSLFKLAYKKAKENNQPDFIKDLMFIFNKEINIKL